MNIMLERGSRYAPFSVLDTVPGVVFSQLGKSFVHRVASSAYNPAYFDADPDLELGSVL